MNDLELKIKELEEKLKKAEKRIEELEGDQKLMEVFYESEGICKN